MKETGNTTTVYSDEWIQASIQAIDKDYYIISDGRLSRKDGSIQFEKDDGTKTIPVETMGNLNIYSEVGFSTNFFEYLNQFDARVSMYNRFGKFIGTFCSAKHSSAADMIIKQIALYNDRARRLDIAKRILEAAAHNMRSNLRYYHKKGRDLEEGISGITDSMKEMRKAKSLDMLMLTEARGRQRYYSCMDEMIGVPEFKFEHRSKQPPENPVNALVSFGNTFLYQKLASEITRASLDVRIGIVHATNRRSESLNLDIAEIFKPIIVDRAIFTLIHKKMIDAKEHFCPFGEEGIYLNAEGKRIFINVLQSKLGSKLMLDGVHITYDALMRKEVRKLYNTITENAEYRPYKYVS